MFTCVVDAIPFMTYALGLIVASAAGLFVGYILGHSIGFNWAMNLVNYDDVTDLIIEKRTEDDKDI